MRRLLCLFSLLCWLLCVPAMAEETPSVRIIDRIADPAAEPDFSFDGDAPLLEMIFPQVLNADAMLLRCGGEAILVDCASAKQASRVTDMLSQLGVDHLDAIINTHPHYDHLQGLENVAGAVAVDALWVSFPADYNQHMVTAMEVAQRLELPVVTYGDEDTYTLGGATLTAWCKGDESWNCNERSAIWKVSFGDATALLTADMMLKTQKRLLEAIPAQDLQVDILKYPHHGLNYATPSLRRKGLMFASTTEAMSVRAWIYFPPFTREQPSEQWRRKVSAPKRASSTAGSRRPMPLSRTSERKSLSCSTG